MKIIWRIFGDKTVKDSVEVMAHVRVCVLIEGEGSRSVFDEQIEQSTFGKVADLSHYLACHQMDATGIGAEGEFNLLYHIGV